MTVEQKCEVCYSIVDGQHSSSCVYHADTCKESSLRRDVAALKIELARIKSCICTRIPSINWHLDKCPARTAAPEAPSESAGKPCKECGGKEKHYFGSHANEGNCPACGEYVPDTTKCGCPESRPDSAAGGKANG